MSYYNLGLLHSKLEQYDQAIADFKQALDFVNRVGSVAEEQGHHPDILLSWGKADITLWTHKIDGLTESDFIMAAKIDRLLST